MKFESDGVQSNMNGCLYKKSINQCLDTLTKQKLEGLLMYSPVYKSIHAIQEDDDKSVSCLTIIAEDFPNVWTRDLQIIHFLFHQRLAT